MGTFSIWHWIVVLIIVVLVFGTKKLRNLGGDLGSAIKGFKEGMKDANPENNTSQTNTPQTSSPDSLTFDDDIKNTAHSFKEAIKPQETTTASETTSTASNTVAAQNSKEESEQKSDNTNQDADNVSKENTQSRT